METTNPLLVPVGHDVGALHGRQGGRCQQIRAGTSLVELSGPEYVVWLLAHGNDDAERPTHTSVLAVAEQAGLSIEDAATIIDQLISDGLLAEVAPEASSAVEFAQRHQLVPLMMGLGPDQDEPGLQTVGLLGRPIAQVSGAVYDVWAWAHLTPQLWVACQDAAEVARRVGVTAPEETEARNVLTGILRSLHGLLCVRAAYVDRRGLA
ncbi:hypothetical protein [Kribbella sp. CA-293567]|uniref:hypothetical protein n=1 Tax=Kribbella sp. CA-293567 TaxID=3002436 RepID=UPI0022DE340F|nr:hypothetical protein [Kribbella sp. CA-293567]WBQ08429.1 hypothetical protein OX958_16810 [Kribbella sp. CA-293567]